jgi:antitoxin (DNA-binding transcriptional repressor) of toxin-antitoxin stability system
MHEFTPLITDEWEQLLGDVEEGEDVYILRGDETVAVLIGVERFDQLLADLAELSKGDGDA